MHPVDYMKLAKRTETPNCPLKSASLSRALHSALGCADESGEIVKNIKDHLFYDKELTFSALKEEYGDLLWFIAIGLDAIGSSFEEVMEMNIAKLRERYPEKFEHDKAINRSSGAELAVLEKFVKDITVDVQEEVLPLSESKTWQGSPITTCQICQQKISKRFIDGKTQAGSWCVMCLTCHAAKGSGLGVGKGQEYVLVGAAFLKINPPEKITVPAAVNQTMIDLIAEAAVPPDEKIKCEIAVYHAIMSGEAPGKIVKDVDGSYSLQLRQ